MKANIERLWRKVEITESCWIWFGAIDSSGYGNIQYNNKVWKAHRLMYTELVGEIPEDKQLDHLCRVRKCVNPDHLEEVSQQENLRRGIYWQTLKTHCPSGHKYDSANTIINKNGHRVCRACRLK